MRSNVPAQLLSFNGSTEHFPKHLINADQKMSITANYWLILSKSFCWFLISWRFISH